MRGDTWWMPYGACAGLGDAADEVFFPRSQGRGSRKDYARAEELCQSCPVRDYCLMYAIAHKIAYGYWGGKSELQRRAIDRDTRVRVRRVWFHKQMQIRLKGGEKLGQRDLSVRGLPGSSASSGGVGDEGRRHSA